MKNNLKISFIIPFTEKTGGILVVLEYYRQLTKLGHKVNIYYPLLPYMDLIPNTLPIWRRIDIWIKRLLVNIVEFKTRLELFSEHIPITPVLRITNPFITNADIIVATAWPTAYSIANLSNSKGKKYYLVQHYENWGGNELKVDKSYQLAIGIITIAPWLTQLLKDKFRINILSEIHNGIRLDRFYPRPNKSFNKPSILMMIHENSWKGTEDGLTALSQIKSTYPEVKIVLFGMCNPPVTNFEHEYYQNPPYNTLLLLYQNATIFISPSHTEGWHLPPMEAMACMCAVVATNVGCIPVLNNGNNLVLIKVRDPNSIFQSVALLVTDPDQNQRIAINGYNSIQDYTWESAAGKMQWLFQ